jgi:hypothetical protein
MAKALTCSNGGLFLLVGGRNHQAICFLKNFGFIDVWELKPEGLRTLGLWGGVILAKGFNDWGRQAMSLLNYNLAFARQRPNTKQPVIKKQSSKKQKLEKTLFNLELCASGLLVQVKGIREVGGATDKEAHIVHTVHIIFQEQYFVARSLISNVDNVFGLHSMCVFFYPQPSDAAKCTVWSWIL